MPHIDTKLRHGRIQEVARYFDYSHLDSPISEFSQQCYDLAANMIHDLPDSHQLEIGLQKLLEAKDCFVRAALDATKAESNKAFDYEDDEFEDVDDDDDDF